MGLQKYGLGVHFQENPEKFSIDFTQVQSINLIDFIYLGEAFFNFLMKEYSLSCLRLFFLSGLFLLMGKQASFAQKQDFEEAFRQVNFPEEFLPGWFGNEVRATSSRIFQAAGLGRNNSQALAVQPISTFEGIIWVKVNPGLFENPTAMFFARSMQNGSGNRPATVYYSWGKRLDGEYSEEIQIGLDSEFANENQEYRRFILKVPESLISEESIFLRLEIRYGAGSGSAARWMMDDFEFGSFIPDQTPPRIQEVKGFDPKSLLVTFSEAIDPVFSILSLAYDLEGLNPQKVDLRADSAAVLGFEDDLEIGRNYRLRIQQIPDLEGNFLRDSTVQVTFFDPTAIPEKTLVINELMPAPRADQDLPNVEFIELVHTGEFEIRLQGVSLSNSRSETLLDDFWLKPGEYLILAPESQASQLASFGKVLPVENWPTLLNSGDELFLKTRKGQLIDRISYTTSSWGGSDFANEGYSLEISNPFYFCSNAGLLQASVDPSRGTPGEQNSTFTLEQDGILPTLERAWFEDPLTIHLDFSRGFFLDLGQLRVDFSPILEIDSVYFLTEKELIIRLKSPAAENEVYRIELAGLKDCWKNELGETEVFPLVLASKPQLGDILINEILFDPRPGDPKFIELRNATQKFLDLDSLWLANLDNAGLPDQERIFGDRGLLLPPDGFLAITTDVNQLKTAYPKSASGNFLQIPTLPSYPIAGGSVVLLSSKKEIMEKVTYNEDFHHPLLRDSKGVSLERISPYSPSSLPSNWQSASGAEDFGTPGRKNSQSLEGEFLENLIQIEPQIFDPEGSSGPAFTSIRYQLDQPGWIGTFKIYSAAGQLVYTLAQNQILGIQGLYQWSGVDTTGQRVRIGYYVLVAELYEPGGKTNLIKKTIVVAARM